LYKQLLQEHRPRRDAKDTYECTNNDGKEIRFFSMPGSCPMIELRMPPLRMTGTITSTAIPVIQGFF